MNYFIIAGEASGDLHGARLIQAIQEKDLQANFKFWGGDLMAAQAPGGLITHYRENAIMGFVEVVMNLGKIKKNFTACKQAILHFKPDVVILIDYPGFNLRMAEFCKKQGIKTVYFIAPKVWAWKENRAKQLEKNVDLLLLIFPFEVDYFKKWKINTRYVGNPLLDEIADFISHKPIEISAANKPLLALLPGSRKQELAKMLPIMLQTLKRFPEFDAVICGAPGLDASAYQPYLSDGVKLEFGKTYEIVSKATAALVCSGTATLETALLGIPQVCGYKANPISMRIAKLLVKVKFISLVNLNLNRAAIPELIQEDFNPERVEMELRALMPGGEKHDQLLNDYQELKTVFGSTGADKRAADAVLELLRN
ncbi:MAG: lipid-A-disaccharide synthase [Bacteroidetes bacterium]|nr:lipid-A-disaccharide synthase [Bacteroidota bacterium]